MFNVLVLCTGNSARSIMLEGILSALGDDELVSYSAGSKPTGTPHEIALATLSNNGIPTEFARSKSWDEFGTPNAPEMDLVITVCDSAANEPCPIWPGAPLGCHWGLDDPAKAEPADQTQAFNLAFDLLKRRAEAFLKLDRKAMAPDQLKHELDMIGKIE